jgi:hypothetical protein
MAILVKDPVTPDPDIHDQCVSELIGAMLNDIVEKSILDITESLKFNTPNILIVENANTLKAMEVLNLKLERSLEKSADTMSYSKLNYEINQDIIDKISDTSQRYFIALPVTDKDKIIRTVLNTLNLNKNK